MQNGWEGKIARTLVVLAVVTAVATALVVDRVDSVALLVLAIVGMYAGLRYGFGRSLAPAEKWLVAIGAIYFGIALAAYLCGTETNLGFRVLGRYLRLLLLIPAYVALRRYTPPRWLVWSALVVGAVVAAGSALVQYVTSGGVERAAGDSLAITFGDLALLTGFLAAVMVPQVAGPVRWWLRGAGIIGLAGGLIASVLSGTRGGWLAIPLLAALLIAAVTRGLSHRWRFGAFAAAVAIAAAVIAVPATGVQARIDEAIAGWHAYTQYRDNVAAVPKSTCISSPVIAHGLAALAVVSDHHAARIEAVDDTASLQAAGFAAACRGGTVLHVTNPGSHDWTWVGISRIVTHADLPGFAGVIARGDGRVRIVGSAEYRLHTQSYRKILLRGPASRYRDYVILGLGVPPGGELFVAPLELNPGAYRYFYTGTSVGARLAMWGAAWDIFRAHWPFGVGTGAYRESAQALVDAGVAAPVAAVYDHPHNQYLNELANRGVIGFIEILLFLGFPAWLFARRIRHADPAVRRPAYAGLMTMCAFAVFGLTETIFNHSLVIDYYVILTALFAALMYERQGHGS